MNTSEGRIVLAATPIGNPLDASRRLLDGLERAQVVAAEDTRKTAALARALGITIAGRLISYHEHNEAGRVAEMIDHARQGHTVLVVTDAGMPAVSDPGYRIVEAAVAAGVEVTAYPGPSAVVTALALSGLPTDRFSFEGFLPRKDGDRARFLGELAAERRTMVFFEAPHRIQDSLEAMAAAFGGARRAALCRELTKTYEQIRRGPLAELATGAHEDPPRGEIVVVVEGAAPGEVDPGTALDRVRELVAAGTGLKQACAEVAEMTGLRKRELYQRMLAER